MFFAPALRTRAYVPARGLDRDFERFLSDGFFRPLAGGPKVEQDDQAWKLSLDVPGVARDQLVIEIDGAIVRVQTKAEATRQFNGAYELPADIDAAASTAKLENGVLTLTLAKQKPVVTARTLEVQ